MAATVSEPGAFGAVHAYVSVLSAAGSSAMFGASRWLEPSGYAVMRGDARGDHLIADFGRVCPDYLPAHAHADIPTLLFGKGKQHRCVR